MKSILYYGLNKELQDQLQNVAYASGAEDFQSVDNLPSLISMLKKEDVSILFVDTKGEDLTQLKKPQKIVLFIDVLARAIVDEDILTKIVVVLKPFSQKALLEIISDGK